MISIFLYFILLTTFSTTNTSNCEITVYIENFENNQGQVIVSLYNDPETFPKKEYSKKISLISNKNAYVKFKNVPQGSYAVMAIHDKNKNGKIDFNFLHIPVEKIAASNNAEGFFGPPDFEDAKFELIKNKNLVIKFE